MTTATELSERPLPEPKPAFCCGDRLRPCSCGADVWKSQGDDYDWYGEGDYEDFECQHCGKVIHVELPD